MYTEFIETGSLYAYMRLCALRMDPQAQKEIREYATVVSKLLEEHYPASMKAVVPRDKRWMPLPWQPKA